MGRGVAGNRRGTDGKKGGRASWASLSRFVIEGMPVGNVAGEGYGIAYDVRASSSRTSQVAPRPCTCGGVQCTSISAYPRLSCHTGLL